ncbi:hypothetical protein PNK_0176 [Candidatus Protochlamydia naegleriophila]|uniref:Uncharacterized protein n=1 Tax=Candidatus Protochlamydia naegleriophila TaxID=389348 RepID=A0A0U5JDG6_9BACT|nr:hypothetical protein [Candidatus Protochlamydia naegleriophila]CUI15814.1 hypothetical protein PNK_0176 [Candidatus Protochlamydia naegleriophila]
MNHLRLGPSYYAPTDVAVTDEVAIDGVEPPVTQAAIGDGIGFRAHMEIQEVLNNITTLQELRPLVLAAKEDIFFWGYRYTYIPGYAGTLPIDALALKVLSIVCRPPGNVKVSYALKRKIKDLWKQSDRRLKEKSVITNLACIIREIWGRVKSLKEGRYSTRDDYNLSLL